MLTPACVTPALPRLPLPRGSPWSWSVWLHGACCLPLPFTLAPAAMLLPEVPPVSCSTLFLPAGPPPGPLSSRLPLRVASEPPCPLLLSPAGPWLLLTWSPSGLLLLPTSGSCLLWAILELEDLCGRRKEKGPICAKHPLHAPSSHRNCEKKILTHLTEEETVVPRGVVTHLGWPLRKPVCQSDSTTCP